MRSLPFRNGTALLTKFDTQAVGKITYKADPAIDP